MGPNNYGKKEPCLLAFVRRNPGLTRLDIINRLGHSYTHSFDRAKEKGMITRVGKRPFTWVVKESRTFDEYMEMLGRRRHGR